MVSLVEDWEHIEDQTKWCRYGVYRVRDSLDGFEVRARVGQFGFKKTFQNEEDPKLNRILEFYKHEVFIKVSGTVPDHLFFYSE